METTIIAVASTTVTGFRGRFVTDVGYQSGLVKSAAWVLSIEDPPSR